LIEVALGSGAFEFFGSDDSFVEEFDAAIEFGLGEFEGLPGVLELGLEGGNLRGSSAFAEVGEVGAGLGQTMFGFVECGEFGGVFEGEDRGGRVDGLAAHDTQGLQSARDGGGSVEVLGLNVTLEGAGRRRGAT
jgi:hypothetical protein